MKMETVLTAPFAARVRELLVATGGQVETGTPLVRLEPIADGRVAVRRRDVDDAAPIRAPDLPASPRRPAAAARRRGALDDLRSLLLGFDLAPQDRPRTPSPSTRRLRAELTWPASSRCCAPRSTSFSVFADLAELDPQPAGRRGDQPTSGCTARASTSTPTCTASTSTASTCPTRSGPRLARVLAHYGVTDLERGPALEEAVFRIFLAQQRTAVRPGRRHHRCSSSGWPTQPPAGDLGPAGPRGARPARAWRPSCATPSWVTWPAARGSAGSTSRSSRRHAPSRAGRRARRARLPGRPPGRGRLRRAARRAGRDPGADRAVPRRAAGARASPSASRCSRSWPAGTTASTSCTTCARFTAAGRPFVTCDYTLDDRPTRLVTTVAQIGGARRVGRPAGLVPRSRRSWTSAPAGHEAVVDLYLHWPGAPDSADAASASAAGACSAALPFARRVRRVAVAVCPGDGRPVSYFTFRPGPAGRRRGRPGARSPPDGRPTAEPVAAA